MTNAEVLKEKEDVVAAISAKLSGSVATIFADYRGLTVGEITKLRGELKQANSDIKVYKNSLIKRALKDLGLSLGETQLVGPTAMVSISEDAATAAKAIVEFVKAYEAASIKCGLLDNESLDESGIKHLASLPSKDILRAKVVGGLKSPITGFVMSLSSPMRGLVMVLNAIKEKK